MNAKLLMIQGTSSGAGKSIMVTALCRILSNKGFKVAPFKSQNMSSFIFKIDNTDKIIAKAQAVQSLASRTEPDHRMNPILLKPVGNYQSEIYINGEFLSVMKAKEYYSDFVLNKGFKIALDAFNSLKKENDILILEGAGSPAEINIQNYDIANMLLAKKVKAPVILISDIERGGCFASIFGTISLLKPKYRNLIKGILINKFLGDRNILQSAIKKIEIKTKKPILGVIPKIDHSIPNEDSLDLSKKDTEITNIKILNQQNSASNAESDIKSLDREIDKLSNIIESVVNMDHILKKIID